MGSFFCDHTTIHVLESLEEILKKREHPRSLENFDVSANDLKHDPELMSSVHTLYHNFREAVSITHKINASFIRNNPNDFVQFEEF